MLGLSLWKSKFRRKFHTQEKLFLEREEKCYPNYRIISINKGESSGVVNNLLFNFIGHKL